MRYEILGPPRISGPGGIAEVTPAKRATLLGVLIVNRGRYLTREQLYDVLWGEERPETARQTVQTYVSHLRRTIESVGGAGPKEIAYAGHGYSFQAEAELDVLDLENGVADAQAALRAQNYERAMAYAEGALRVIRGPLLGHVDKGPVLSAWAQVYRDHELEAEEAAIRALLGMGRPQAAIARASVMVAREPTREGFCRLLMLAHYRCGQAPQAAAAYLALRKRLVDSYGMEPSRELAELHSKVIRREPV